MRDMKQYPPLSITALACFPTSVPAATAARSMSPVESWGIPSLSTILGPWVPFPVEAQVTGLVHGRMDIEAEVSAIGYG
jgi:hypothetical protein